MNKIQNSIDRINCEIASKTVSLKEMDVAAETALASLISHEEPEDNWQDTERARRRGEASRPRGGTPRIRNQTHFVTMMNSQEKENLLPPQGFRGPSGRHAGSTVPGTRATSSSAGPSTWLPAGEENKKATVPVENEKKTRDYLDLTFVDSIPHERDESQELDEDTGCAAISTPYSIKSRNKRKALTWGNHSQ